MRSTSASRRQRRLSAQSAQTIVRSRDHFDGAGPHRPLEPKLNAFAHLGAEQAMEAAAEADSALARGARSDPCTAFRDHQGSRTRAGHAV